MKLTPPHPIPGPWELWPWVLTSKKTKTKTGPHFQAGMLQGCCLWAEQEKKKSPHSSKPGWCRLLPSKWQPFHHALQFFWGFIKNSRGTALNFCRGCCHAPPQFPGGRPLPHSKTKQLPFLKYNLHSETHFFSYTVSIYSSSFLTRSLQRN